MPSTTAGIINGDSRRADSAARPGKRCRAMAKAAGKEISTAALAATSPRRRLTQSEAMKSRLRSSSLYHCRETPSHGRAR